LIRPGQPAPDFELPSSEGGRLALSSLRGKPVVLYFYPKDMTPGCTKQACAFRDAGRELRKLGAVVLGVSPDDARRTRASARPSAWTSRCSRTPT
jgi:peroxiredoxin Q/BCP